jgi:hypothetical protein
MTVARIGGRVLDGDPKARVAKPSGSLGMGMGTRRRPFLVVVALWQVWIQYARSLEVAVTVIVHALFANLYPISLGVPIPQVIH